ncbi:hypothetical protein L1887_18511 [Cichorium endivia]|nr:hypothetical protein L1887_18511 [Cichorium endivia]
MPLSLAPEFEKSQKRTSSLLTGRSLNRSNQHLWHRCSMEKGKPQELICPLAVSLPSSLTRRFAADFLPFVLPFLLKHCAWDSKIEVQVRNTCDSIASEHYTYFLRITIGRNWLARDGVC